MPRILHGHGCLHDGTGVRDRALTKSPDVKGPVGDELEAVINVLLDRPEKTPEHEIDRQYELVAGKPRLGNKPRRGRSDRILRGGTTTNNIAQLSDKQGEDHSSAQS